MIRKFTLALAMTFVAGFASAFDISDMNAAEKQAFRDAVRDYLLENPEVIFEAVDVYEQRQQQAEARADIDRIRNNAEQIYQDGRSWVGGNPDGDVTVVEFLDYRCGYCKKAFADVTDLIETDGNIRLIVKEFPILGEESTLASRFAIAVRNTFGADSYKLAHDELMIMRGSVNRAALRRIAGRIDLDFGEIEAAMSDPEVNDELRANHALARELNITGTPGFVFDNQMLRGYAPLDAMRDIVRSIRG